VSSKYAAQGRMYMTLFNVSFATCAKCSNLTRKDNWAMYAPVCTVHWIVCFACNRFITIQVVYGGSGWLEARN